MMLDNFKIAVIVIMITTGSLNTINQKFQNKQYVSEGQYINKHYYHPYVQTFLMFFGQALALPLYFIIKSLNKQAYADRQYEASKKGKTTDYNILLISVRSFIDSLLTISQSIALNFLSGSIHQMMRSGTVISTCLFSVLILGMKIRTFQILSITLTMIGIGVIGIINLTMEGQQLTSQQQNLKIVGYLLMIFVIVLNGFQFVYEEWLFSKYHIEPMFMIGMEGVFGLVFMTIILQIASYIYCPFGVSACVYNDQSQPYIDRVDVFLRQIGEHKQILIAILLYINTVYICNTAAVFITKTINALARAICQVSRIVCTWIIGIIISLTLGQNQANYKWQATEIKTIMLKIIGFILIVVANLIYNQIITFQVFSQQYIDYDIQHKKIRHQD